MESFLSERKRVAMPALPPAVNASAHAFNAVAGGTSAKASSGSGGATVPLVECVREGERITRLIVTCGCGERIEIDCIYHQ
jgi:hypothetical protein